MLSDVVCCWVTRTAADGIRWTDTRVARGCFALCPPIDDAIKCSACAPFAAFAYMCVPFGAPRRRRKPKRKRQRHCVQSREVIFGTNKKRRHRRRRRRRRSSIRLLFSRVSFFLIRFRRRRSRRLLSTSTVFILLTAAGCWLLAAAAIVLYIRRAYRASMYVGCCPYDINVFASYSYRIELSLNGALYTLFVHFWLSAVTERNLISVYTGTSCTIVENIIFANILSRAQKHHTRTTHAQTYTHSQSPIFCHQKQFSSCALVGSAGYWYRLHRWAWCIDIDIHRFRGRTL